jgi:RHS repeat-associated protein
LSSLVYPDNEEVIFAPNALGEPSKIGSYATLIKYHPNGALASFTYGNQLTHVTTQNARGLPFESFEGGIINDKYAFDANANVSGITDQLSNVSSRSMTYDGLDRLKSVAAPALWGNAAYGYDSLDNLTSTKLDIGGTKRTTIHNIDYTDSNHTGTYRLISTVGDPGYNFVYEYDVQGNVKKRGAQPYVFDQANRMKSATGKATYRYDGLGRRISTVGTDGVNRIQVYAQNGPLLYSVPGTASPTKFVYLDTHVLAEVTGSVVTYNHTDALGSPVAQTNAAGAVLSRTRYEPYGYVAAGSPKTIGFTGHTNDNETGLIYMQQRYYDPLAGRFFSVDEVTTNGSTGAGFNRYSYANNNPYTNFDPDGRNPLLIAPIVGAVVGGAINAADQYLTTGTVRWGGLGGVIDAAGDGAMFGLLGGAAVGSRSAINAPQATPKPDFLVTPGGVAVRNSPAGVRESLDKAGIASKAVQNKTGTETGTVHNVPSMKMDVRVMDGGPDHPPRVITSRQGSSQGVNPADGKNFGNIPKDDQRARSHIEFK